MASGVIPDLSKRSLSFLLITKSSGPMCVATGNWLAWYPGLAATAKTLPCSAPFAGEDTEKPASINFFLVSASGTIICSPVPFAFSPFALLAPLLGTYSLPLGASNAVLGKLASVKTFSGILVSASTNKGYNPPSSLCTNSLYAFLVCVNSCCPVPWGVFSIP